MLPQLRDKFYLYLMQELLTGKKVFDCKNNCSKMFMSAKLQKEKQNIRAAHLCQNRNINLKTILKTYKLYKLLKKQQAERNLLTKVQSFCSNHYRFNIFNLLYKSFKSFAQNILIVSKVRCIPLQSPQELNLTVYEAVYGCEGINLHKCNS